MKTIFKRILVLTLSVIICFGNFAFADDTQYTPSQINERELDILKVLGVLTEDDILEYDDTITRAQGAHFVATLTGVSAMNKLVEGKFSDVNSRTDYATDIITLSDLGVIKGHTDGSFCPDDDILGMEFIKVILSAAGYTIKAESSGGYPSGYLKVASETKLISGITSDLYEPLCFGDLVKLLYNALEIEVVSSDYYSNKGSIYLTSSEDKTVLTELLRTYKDEGVISSNSIMSLTKNEGCLAGNVIINNTLYDVGETNAETLLGHKVEYYYQKTSQKDLKLVYVYVSDEEKTLKIDSDDFKNYDGKAFNYYSDDGDKKAKVNNRTSIVYNNRPIDLPLDFKPLSGNIELIDNDKDSIYDVVFICQYRNIYTNQIDHQNGIIYDIYDSLNPLKINPLDVGDNVLIYNRKGMLIPFEHLKADSLLACLISDDESSMVIYEVVDEIIGTIKNVETTNGKKKIVIEDKEYEISNELLNENINWTIGDKIICYLDLEGKIGAVSDKKVSKYRFAIFESLGIKESMQNEYLIKVFDEGSSEGELTVYEFADKVYIDDYRYTKDDLADISKDALEVILGEKRNLIMYSKNAEGKINNIYTINSDKIHMYSDFVTYYVNTEIQVLDGKIGYNANTLMFFVPTATTTTDKYKFTYALGSLSHQSSTNMKIYKLNNDDLDASVIIRKRGSTEAPGRRSPTLLVDYVTPYVNADGDVVQKIYGYEGTAYVSLETADSDTMDKMSSFMSKTSSKYKYKRGDVITYANDSKGKVSGVELLFRPTEEDKYKLTSSTNPSTTSYNNSQRIIFGSVYNKNKNAFQITTLTDLTEVTSSALELYKVLSGTAIYVYETKKDEVRVGTIADITDYQTDKVNYSKVCIYSDYGKINALLVIK